MGVTVIPGRSVQIVVVCGGPMGLSLASEVQHISDAHGDGNLGCPDTTVDRHWHCKAPRQRHLADAEP